MAVLDLAAVDPADPPPYLQAQLLRHRALSESLSHDGDTGPETVADVRARLRAAIDMLTRIGFPYVRAMTQLDLAEHLLTHHGDGLPADVALLLADAGAVFDRLGARPAAERLDKLRAQNAVTS